MSSGAQNGVPRPIGYTEYSTSIFGEATKNVDAIHAAIDELKAKVRNDEPGLMLFSMRAEHVMDGAGVEHTNFYLGYVPKRELSPPPNPHNLNEAPPPPIGSMPTELELGLPVGWREQQFKR